MYLFETLCHAKTLNCVISSKRKMNAFYYRKITTEKVHGKAIVLSFSDF